ncbi:MAG TPA: NAD-dependent epimerase/dehydratase family protein [Steroidobacteraceae bacterium]
MTTRRDLIGRALALLALQRLAQPVASAAAPAGVEPARRPLDLLFLGGTGFLGPYQIEHALARGHRVAMFNRGRSAAGLYGDRVETLIGNRDSRIDAGLSALAGPRHWDAVIDSSGYLPRHVRESAELLKGRIGRYIFVSTVAVYDPAAGEVFDESSPLSKSPDPPTEEMSWALYGRLKADCDRAVRAIYGDACTVVRPVFIVGPGDDTDRFTYWVERAARGGEVLGPPDPKRALQWVDVRDLCPWIIDLAERDQAGVYNAAGPDTRTSWEQVLRTLATSATTPARFHWPAASLLEEMHVELPLVNVGGKPRYFEADRSRAAGLRYRPLEDTAQAALAWWQTQSAERRARAEGWPTPEEERAVLARMGSS